MLKASKHLVVRKDMCYMAEMALTVLTKLDGEPHGGKGDNGDEASEDDTVAVPRHGHQTIIEDAQHQLCQNGAPE